MLDPADPISKKAPGDRPISFEEIEAIASLIRKKEAEGKVGDLPEGALKEVLAHIAERAAPPLLTRLLPAVARDIPKRLVRIVKSGEIGVRVVDLEEQTGFPREKARPACEVLLVRKGDELLWRGKKALLSEEGASARIYLTEALVRKARSRPGLLAQAIVHPILEWVFDLPHIAAVLCESHYNAQAPEGNGEDVSDLNRFLAEEAGHDRDFPYFDRILGASYEPDEFRMEELRSRFGGDEGKVAEVAARARGMAEKYRALVDGVLSAAREEAAREQVVRAREILDEGDSDRALQVLRKLHLSPDTSEAVREEASALISQAIRSLAHDADPAYEGLSMEKGAVRVEPQAGRKARAFAALLASAAELVRRQGESAGVEGKTDSDPLAVNGAPRSIHVVTDLDRPSAKFIDGHDHVHWEFEKAFVEALVPGFSAGTAPGGIPALLACRFIRDGVFPDEKLKIDRQFAVAVKAAVEAYRFYQSLPAETRGEMAAFCETGGVSDPLYRLFLSLGAETQPARASHLIRREVGRTHSFNYVRYPDTSLAGRVVVVTGGGTGMGRSLALEAVKGGANVVLAGRRPAPLAETKADLDDLIRHLGLTNQTLLVQGDVSDPKYVTEMFERVEREFGRIDLLYNNAGVSGPVEFGSVYEEDHFEQYKEAVGIHLTGSWLASLEAARVMEAQPGGGVIVMVGTFYSESLHRHVLHAYPGRLPYTSAQSAKLALGDYLAWMLAGKNITVLSLNPSAVSTERIQKGSGVFDKGSRARARIGRTVSPDALEKDTLERTVAHEFVHPRDFARVALEFHKPAFRRTLGGQRLPMGGVTYEQPPGILPSPAALTRYPDMVGKVALVTLHRPLGSDIPLFEGAVAALCRSGASVVLAGSRPGDLEPLALRVNSRGGEGMATVHPANLSNPSEVQELFDGVPRLDLLLHFTGSVDWKRPLTHLPFEEWTACVEQFGYVPRLLSWQAERRMDRERIDGTIVLVGPDLSGVPSIRERNLVQVFHAMLRPAVATESMERALMRKAQAEGTAPAHVSDVNIGLVLPGRSDGRNRRANPDGTAATVLWLLEEGKSVSGAILLPDETNGVARLPDEPREESGSLAGKVAVVTGGIRNLGGAISLRFAGEKATVVAASRRPRTDGLAPDEAQKAKEELSKADGLLARMRRAGGRCLWIDADVSRAQKVRAVIDETRNRFGRIDAFVNNAGAGGDFALFTDVMREHRPSWDAVLRTNFLGPWAAVSLLRDLMRNQTGGGTIVNVSTHYADHPYLFRTIYTVSKILLKSLTLALREPLERDNVRMADVAPSLIAGPRMEWVMRNYANRFASQFEGIREMRGAEKKTLQDLFLRSFEPAGPPEDREAARGKFLKALRESSLPKGRRAELEGWYARIREWFRATVPEDPPTNEQVADAVLFAAKNARFLEDRFVGVSALPPFSSFPPADVLRKREVSGDPFVLLATGNGTAPDASALDAALLKAGGRLTSLVEAFPPAGRVDITRPARAGPRGATRHPLEKLSRDLDLRDPRVLEPWLDNSLLGEPPPAGAILCIGTSGAAKSLLGFSFEEMDGFLSHVGKVQNALAESVRAVREDGAVVVIAPPGDAEEAVVLRAALRQMARTLLAERYFLQGVKKVRVALLVPRGDDRVLSDTVVDIVAGRVPATVESVPVGRPRP